MRDTPYIELRDVGKRFSKGFDHGHQALGGELAALFWGRKLRQAAEADPEMFWALRNITLEVGRGEALGVIGHNGAGKTTLLRMLNGEMVPDCGHLGVRGNRSSLIDLTGGFSMSLSGRENIYYRGAHLGFDREFLLRKEGEILDFTELGDFIDSPIKTYSSGMLLRLGFAITVFGEPDVLLVDEIMSVGDFLFQQKCMNRINEMRDRSAVVMVSHSMPSIVNFCDRCLLLDRGMPIFLGAPKDAVEAYYELEAEKQRRGLRLSRGVPRIEYEALRVASGSALEGKASEEESDCGEGRSDSRLTQDGPLVAGAPAQVSAEFPSATATTSVFENSSTAFGPADLPSIARAAMHEFMRNEQAISEVRHSWSHKDGELSGGIRGAGGATLTIEFNLLRRIRRLVIGVPIWSDEGVLVTACGTHGRPMVNTLEAGCHRLELHIPALRLNKGRYFPVVGILDHGEFLYRWPTDPLDVEKSPEALVWGLMTFEYHWKQTTFQSRQLVSGRAQ